MNPNRANQKTGGFTLTEIMVSMGVSSMVMIGFILCYLSFTKMISGTMNQLKVQSYARQGLDYILWDIRRGIGCSIYSKFGDTVTNSDAGAYIVIQFPTNAFPAPYTNKWNSATVYHHYYVTNIAGYANGLTNGALMYFESGTTNSGTYPALAQRTELIRGVSNSDRTFDWINGVININIRVADENDADGKQIIYLRSAVAFRNRNGEN